MEGEFILSRPYRVTPIPGGPAARRKTRAIAFSFFFGRTQTRKLDSAGYARASARD
jgi:hypothetical protein